MAYIRNFRTINSNRAVISGSNVQVTGSLFGSAISGTTAQFTSLTGSTAYFSNNVGIGTNSPSTKLHISGGTGLTIDTINATWANFGANIAASNYMQLRRPGSAAALGYIGGAAGGAISGFTQNDLAIRSEADLHLAAGGNTSRLVVSGNGNVGIGTSSPATALHVQGEARSLNFSDNNGNYNVNLANGNMEGRGLVAGYSGGSYGGIGYNIRHTTTGSTYISPQADTTNYILFSQGFQFLGDSGTTAGRTTNFAELMRITNAGNVGIGTTSPSSLLHVNGNTLVAGDLSVNGGDLTTTATTFNLLNTNATTINAFQAASAINIGSTNNASTVLRITGSTDASINLISTQNTITDGEELGRISLSAPITSSSSTLGSRGVMAFLRDGLDGAGKIQFNCGVGNSASTRTNLLNITKDGCTIRDGLIIGTTSGNVTQGSGDLIVSGSTTAYGNVTLSSANLVIGTSGNGISFANTTPDGSSAANISELLSDYEEGTFTPGAAATLGEMVFLDAGGAKGHYVKIGKIVNVFIELNISSTTGTTQTVSITGLPFVSYSGTNSHTTVGFARIDSSSTNMILALVTNAANSTTLNLRKKTASSTTDAGVTVLDIGSSSVITVSFTYRAST